MTVISPVNLSPPPPYAATRHDGWTAARQAHFLACLAHHGSVTLACDMVGKRCTSAYRLRRRPDAAGFAAAWDACLVPRFDTHHIRRRDADEGGERGEGQDVASHHQLHQHRATPDGRLARAEAPRGVPRPPLAT